MTPPIPHAEIQHRSPEQLGIAGSPHGLVANQLQRGLPGQLGQRALGLEREHPVVEGAIGLLGFDRENPDADDDFVGFRAELDPETGDLRMWKQELEEIEVPAGKIDPNEDRLAAAKRELQEETGFRAKKWTKLVRYYASPGFLAEWMQVFLAEGLTPGLTSLDEDELVEVMLVPFSELLRLINKGEIHDGKTLIASMYYARMRARDARR